jgi:predicted enzyme related to lactoylglutathione lyase
MSDQGRFTWYELMSTDPKAALDFYANLTGWTHQSWDGDPGEGMEDMDYDLWMLGEEPIAGCTQLPAQAQEMGAPPHWVGYVHCDDIAATKAKAIELGAHELASVELPEVGKIAVMHDPDHAVIGLFQSASDPTPEQAPSLGHMGWHELMTGNYETIWPFYSELFGWEVMEDMDMGEAGVYRMFGRGETMLGGMFNRPAEVPVSSWTYYVDIADVDAAAEALVAAGGQVVQGPMDVPGGGRIVQAKDPQGAMFALHRPAPAQD